MNSEKQQFNKIAKFITDSYTDMYKRGNIILKSVGNTFVVNDINNNVISFDIVYDMYFIQTNTAFIIDKLVFDNGIYLSPKTPNNVLALSKAASPAE